MNFDWQTAVTIGLVVAAALYVVRRLRRLGGGKQRAGCGACGPCPTKADQKQVISIDPPPKR